MNLGQSLVTNEEIRDRHSHAARVIARMKPGITIEQAMREMKSISKQLKNQYPASNAGKSVEVASFLDDYVANVANLLLARAGLRRKEIAIRLAVGARRLTIVRQLLVESAILAVAGATIRLPVRHE